MKKKFITCLTHFDAHSLVTGGAGILNTVVFHTRMVDQLDAVLVETSDLSIFCFYARLFEDYFQMCLEFPAQNRYDD